MEIMEVMNLFGDIYRNKKVLVTGHTGFKGSWLAFWLKELGAQVYGFSLAPSTTPSHFELLGLEMNSQFGDIRNYELLKGFINEVQPDIVFHLAAQSLVLESYKKPIDTYTTNVIGTLNVFESCRSTLSVKAIINVTTDKVYENLEKEIAYKESDRLGGYDIYSSSKACAELLTSSYKKSFLQSNSLLLASARAGNVIGGGDWAEERILPDLVRAASSNNQSVIRNPNAIRPWEHVLEPLSGYLYLGSKLLNEEEIFAQAWNFGPTHIQKHTVGELVSKSSELWDKISTANKSQSGEKLHEANILMLDCSMAKDKLKWHSVWNFEQTVSKTIEWYKNYYEENIVSTKIQIEQYVIDAKIQSLDWCK
jgi:CDP-glucose 4,6-dehydratase